MVNVFEDLGTLGKKAYAEGDAPDELPSEFYTVSEDYTGDNLHADNRALEISYEFTITYYTKDAGSLYQGILDAKNALMKKGYVLSGVGRGATSYKDWYARSIDAVKIENLERN